MVILLTSRKNASNHYIYLKSSGSHIIILVLYVDDILLVRSSVELLTETKFVLNSHFDKMDLGNVSIAFSFS